MINAIEEIKSRLSIEQVVAQYVQLKQAGRNFKGLCPFHKEKTPSFIVSTEKQLAYCFGCNKGGDIFKFTQEIENVDFKEALKLLADKAGVRLDERTGEHATSGHATKDRKMILHDINRAAKDFFKEKLWETTEGAEVLDYLRKRGMKDETIKEFELGFSPDSFEETYTFLLKNDFTKDQIAEAGVAISKGIGTDRIFDRFRGRLMFPIADSQGKIVGFGGRALKKDDEPKYLNSPETPIYNKSSVVYGLHEAKSFIKDKEEVIVVEGYMDVIAAHEAGTKNAVASSGTAFTMKQLEILKRITKNIIFSFDTDAAGEEATRRAMEIAQGMDVNIRIVRVLMGKDPDECIRSNLEKWKESLNSAKFYLDYYLEKMAKEDLSDSVKKKAAIAEILKIIKGIKNKIEMDAYVEKLANLLNIKKPAFIYDELAKLKTGLLSTKKRDAEAEILKTIEQKSVCAPDEYFLGLMLAFPDYFAEIREAARENYFREENKQVYKALNDHYNIHAAINPEDFLKSISEEERKRLEFVSFWTFVKNENISKEFIKKEILNSIERMRKVSSDNERQRLIFSIKKADQEGRREEKAELLKRYNEILKAKS